MFVDGLETACASYPGHLGPTSAARLIVAALLALSMAMLTSCGSGHGSAGTPLPPGNAGGLRITTSPALSPAFDPAVTDYAFTYKPGSPVQVSVDAPENTTVSVDGQAAKALTSTTLLNLTPGQSFSFVVNSAGVARTYFARCLPTDFPTWTTERTGTPQSEYYVVAPTRTLNGGALPHYSIIVDGFGVPVWWYRGDDVPVDAKILPNGNFAWASPPSGQERTLDGVLVRTFSGAGILGGVIDSHELLQLPNGNNLFIVNVNRTPVDLTPYGGAANSTVIDNVIVESAPNGSIAWQWSAMDHISPAETDPHWWSEFFVPGTLGDPYHMNSVERDGDGYVVSLRHMNAVIRIDRATGSILWKLGGSTRPESLTFRGDAYGNFGGQHDARVLANNTLTLYDNGTLLGRPPRGVHYSLDLAARTATLLEQTTNPDVPQSLCCGSARKLDGGNWVASWASTPNVTDQATSGARVFLLTFQAPYFSYRAVPVPFGTVTRAALRKGMDTQFPR